MTKPTQSSITDVRKRLGLSPSEMAQALSQVRFRELPGTLADVRSFTRQKIWQYEHSFRNPDKLVQLALAVLEKRAKKKKGKS